METSNFNFFTEFIDIDFDNILLQNNNPLFNSQEHYFDYKQQYLEQARQNKEAYEQIVEELIYLQSSQIVKTSPTKVIYTYVDMDRLNLLKQNKKNILRSQRESLQNFLHYLHQLNIDSCNDTFSPKKRSPSTKSIASIESKRSVKSTMSKASGIIARFKRGSKKG